MLFGWLSMCNETVSQESRYSKALRGSTGVIITQFSDNKIANYSPATALRTINLCQCVFMVLKKVKDGLDAT